MLGGAGVSQGGREAYPSGFAAEQFKKVIFLPLI